MYTILQSNTTFIIENIIKRQLKNHNSDMLRPEDGLMKEAEMCHCYDFLIISKLYFIQ